MLQKVVGWKNKYLWYGSKNVFEETKVSLYWEKKIFWWKTKSDKKKQQLKFLKCPQILKFGYFLRGKIFGENSQNLSFFAPI